MNEIPDEAYYSVRKSTMEDGGLYSLGWYLAWEVGEKWATLDGEFTSEELRAIADHMDGHRREVKK